MFSRHLCDFFFPTQFFLKLGLQEKVPSAAAAYAKESHFANVCVHPHMGFFL